MIKEETWTPPHTHTHTHTHTHLLSRTREPDTGNREHAEKKPYPGIKYYYALMSGGRHLHSSAKLITYGAGIKQVAFDDRVVSTSVTQYNTAVRTKQT